MNYALNKQRPQPEGTKLKYTRFFEVSQSLRIDVFGHVMPQDDVAPSQLCDIEDAEDDIIPNIEKILNSFFFFFF